MTRYAYFKHSITGKVTRLPEQYGVLFKDVLTEVDSSEAECLDCGFKEPNADVDEDLMDQSNEQPEVTILPLEEPAPRRSRRTKDTVE